MPIVDVTFDRDVPGDVLERLRRVLLDVGELAIVVEARTRRLPSRVDDAQPRVDRMRDALHAVLDPIPFGVWLVLHDGAWSQSA